MIGKKAYLLNAGDTFTLEEQKDGKVFFRANELRLSVPERVVELMAPATPEVSTADAKAMFPEPIGPTRRVESHVSDKDLDGTNAVEVSANPPVEINPNYDFRIDRVGRRFRIEQQFIFVPQVTATFNF